MQNKHKAFATILAAGCLATLVAGTVRADEFDDRWGDALTVMAVERTGDYKVYIIDPKGTVCIDAASFIQRFRAEQFTHIPEARKFVVKSDGGTLQLDMVVGPDGSYGEVWGAEDNDFEGCLASVAVLDTDKKS